MHSSSGFFYLPKYCILYFLSMMTVTRFDLDWYLCYHASDWIDVSPPQHHLQPTTTTTTTTTNRLLIALWDEKDFFNLFKRYWVFPFFIRRIRRTTTTTSTTLDQESMYGTSLDSTINSRILAINCPLGCCFFFVQKYTRSEKKNTKMKIHSVGIIFKALLLVLTALTWDGVDA